MRIGLLVWYALWALGGRWAVAQDRTGLPAPGSACIDFNQTALSYIAVGRLKDAESVLSSVLTDPKSGSQQQCGSMTLHNLALVMALSGRLVEAEVFETRSLKILEKSYPSDDPVLRRALQLLAQIQFQQQKIGKARETLRRLQSIPTGRPEDHAIAYGLAATLLCAERRHHQAEAEYRKALGAWEEAGRAGTVDAAATLDALAALYVTEGRYREAERILDRANAIVTSDRAAVATDRIKLLRIRAQLHIRQREWRQAEADLDAAISTAGHDPQFDPVSLKSLLANYAYVLRKDHRGTEARRVEARAASLQTPELTQGVVDISELLRKSTVNKE
jgi:tetratricopeptide (TPR) repeat protein